MSSFMKFPNNQKFADLRGDGVTNSAGQGASGMSGLGGTIRLGELTGERPLRHAIKTCVLKSMRDLSRQTCISCFS